MNNTQYKYDAIFYDFDGTLADSVPVIMECFKLAYNDVLGRCDRTDADLLSYIGKPLIETFQMHDEETSKALFDSYIRHNEKALVNNELPLFEGVREELEKIQALGIYQGIVTSKRKKSLMTSIEVLHLEKNFDSFIHKELTEGHKPGPEPLLYAMEKAGLTDSSRVLYVGDAAPDILCAQAASCDSVLVGWTRMPKEELIKLDPTYVIEDISELSCIIGLHEL